MHVHLDLKNIHEIPNTLIQKNVDVFAKFSIKQLFLFPNVDEVVYYHVDHTMKDESPAHG